MRNRRLVFSTPPPLSAELCTDFQPGRRSTEQQRNPKARNNNFKPSKSIQWNGNTKQYPKKPQENLPTKVQDPPHSLHMKIRVRSCREGNTVLRGGRRVAVRKEVYNWFDTVTLHLFAHRATLFSAHRSTINAAKKEVYNWLDSLTLHLFAHRAALFSARRSTINAMRKEVYNWFDTLTLHLFAHRAALLSALRFTINAPSDNNFPASVGSSHDGGGGGRPAGCALLAVARVGLDAGVHPQRRRLVEAREGADDAQLNVARPARRGHAQRPLQRRVAWHEVTCLHDPRQHKHTQPKSQVYSTQNEEHPVHNCQRYLAARNLSCHTISIEIPNLSTVRLLASHHDEPGSIPRRVTPGFSRVGIVPGGTTSRRVFSGIYRFPPSLHSGATPFSSHFTFIGSQDLVVKSSPNLSTQHWKTVLTSRWELRRKSPPRTILTARTRSSPAPGPALTSSDARQYWPLTSPSSSTSRHSSKSPSWFALPRSNPDVSFADESITAEETSSYYLYSTVLGHGGRAVRLIASHQGEKVSIPGRITSRIFTSGNRARRCHWSLGFLRDLPFSPPLHSGTTLFPPNFTLFGPKYLAVKSSPNLSTQLYSIVIVTALGSEVTFAIGSHFIRHYLHASKPIADLQRNTLRIL
ncbi:hypothetical protein PR048_019311 [Dryococelus australis]|uniref:Uncharacterized protein n=1 Tax=Dryococelus australis TaxID=614101 RepID=A0ABQ9H377_9NEOP|nr:hypothetical protein PR048_019311 [Dryococelus australis]